MDDSAAAPETQPITVLTGGRRKAALGFIFATSLMDVISLGIMIPVLPNLVKEMVGGDTGTATLWTGVFAMTWGLMQFVCSPITGMLSDRFGRRPVLLISIFGLSVDYLFMALAPTLAWLYIGRILNGITASSFSTAGAYIADITPPEDRAKNFGLIGAAFSIGFVIGPAIGGQLGEIDLRLPFYVAFGMGAINWLYGLLILPESLPPERRIKKFNWAKANPVGSFKLLRSHPDLLGLASVLFLFQLAHNVFPAIFVLFTGHRFDWSPGDVGFMMMGVGLSSALVQFFLVRPVVKALGERKTLIAGIIAFLLGMIIYGFAPNGRIFLLGIPVMAFSALIGPGLQGLMTRRVAPNEQGQLQGANSAIMGICTVIGPPMFTGLFYFSIREAEVLNLPGLPMLFSAVLIGLALIVALQVAKPVKPTAAS